MISCVVRARADSFLIGTVQALPLLVLCAGACAKLSGASDMYVTGGSGGVTSSGGSGGSGMGGLSGTSGVGATAGVDAGGDGAAGSGQIDYTRGTWQVENLSSSPDRFSREPTMVLAGTELFVAWTDQDAANKAQIFARPVGKPATMVTTAGGTSPSLAYSAGQVLLAWTSAEDGDYDVYLANGPTFSERFNLTVEPQTNVDGVLAVGGGTNAVAHRTWIGESVVEVRTWTDPASTTSTQVISGKGSCDRLSLLADSAGKLHLLTICPSGVGGGNVLYTDNVLGSWVAAVDIASGTTGNRNGALALGADDTWYAVWTSGLDDLILATKVGSGAWSPPKVVLSNVGRSTIAVDPEGRLLIAFDRPDESLHFTWAEGEGFAAPISVGPGTAPNALLLDAAGLPCFVFQNETVSGQTASSDVWLAKFVPSG